MKIKKISFLILLICMFFMAFNVSAAEKVCCVNKEAKATGDERDNKFSEACSRYYGGTIKSEAECKGTTNNGNNGGNSGNNSSSTPLPAPEPTQDTQTTVTTETQTSTQNGYTTTKLCCTDNGTNLNITYNQDNEQACNNAGGGWKDPIITEVCVFNGQIIKDISKNECENNLKGLWTKTNACPIAKPKGICCKGKEWVYTATTEAECTGGYYKWQESGTCISDGNDEITISFDCNDSGVRAVLKIVKVAYLLLKYATPIILVLTGSIDFLRATIASSAEDIEKNKKRFFNRLLIAVLIFVLASIIQLMTNMLGSSGVEGTDNWVTCLNSLWITLIH